MDAHLALHPTDQTLSSYGLGKLDDGSAEAVNQHLEECPDCRKRVAELSADSFLERVRGAQARPDSPAPVVSPLAGVSMLADGPPAPTPPPSDTLPPGLADHPDYEVIRELGRGGMGVVYLVRNKLMGRLEVLKVVGGHLVERAGVRDRFLREVQSAAKLQHKNIVTAYSAIRLGQSIVLAMEYVDGNDLAKVVKSDGPLPVINACYFIYQAALGIQHAHERGMVHRDIKPANLIVARDGKKAIVTVLDFGLAKVTSEGQTDSGLTREGQMLGTPDFIAPEQIRDAQSADIRADIYSLGCTFYFLLTGGPPFHGEHLWDVYQAHFSMNAGPLNLVRPEVPVELAASVAKMMAKETGRRFQTPGEVARELTRFFRPAASQPSASSAETSHINPPSTPTQTWGVGHTASSPQPVGGGFAPAQPMTLGTVPAPAPRGPSKPNPEGVAWQSLIEFKETEPLIAAAKPKSEVTPISAPVRRPPWVWASVATGVLTFVLFAAWLGGAFKVKTPDGVIVLENLPKDYEVVPDPTPEASAGGAGVLPARVEDTAAKTPSVPSDNAKAWSRLMAKLGRQSSGPAPYACWTFESDARDEIGSLHGSLLGGAAVREGRLCLDGKKAYVRTPSLSRDIREKTLEAWVLLPNLDQRGGDVISIQYGVTFDAIIFGEREPKKWIAGSEWFRRTMDLDTAIESAKSTNLIHMAIVYDADGGITVYREGTRYAARYVPRGDQATLRAYLAGESHVLFGQRETGAGNGFLTGAIEEARLYDRALTAGEVAASYRAGVIHRTTENGVEKVSETGPAAVKTVEGKPPARPAAEAVKTTARALPGKTPATRRRGGGTEKADITPPFRVATNGLAGTQFIDPISFGPHDVGINEPGTASPWWDVKDAFARLTTTAALAYPPLPVSRYVLEVELTVHKRGAMAFFSATRFAHPTSFWTGFVSRS
jgi:serine/threonine protein kinase